MEEKYGILRRNAVQGYGEGKCIATRHRYASTSVHDSNDDDDDDDDDDNDDDDEDALLFFVFVGETN